MLTNALTKAEINRLDAEILLAHVLEKDRSWLIAHADTPLSQNQEKQFAELCERRKNHEPIAYIIGEKEFYGRKFIVDKRVLIPRPSTETLIDETQKFLINSRAGNRTCATNRITKADTEIVVLSERFKDGEPKLIIDVGTGSGCIGITLALEFPDIDIICTDISDDALKVAKVNAKRHKVSDRITFITTSLIPSNIKTFEHNEPNQPKKPNQLMPFLLVSNPPYIPECDQLQTDVYKYEPHTALFAGEDGMNVILPLWKSAKENPNCVGIVLECRREQSDSLLGATESQKLTTTN